MTHPTADQLAAFDAGLLAGPDRQTVEAHVAACPVCCGLLEDLPETPLVALVRAYAKAPDPDTSPGAVGPGLPPAELAGHPRYRVLEEVGRGGMGAVYKAIHVAMNRVVALKALHPELTARPGFLERFRKEVQAVAQLSHPHVVTAHDADSAGSLHFLVMEYVEGESLASRLRRDGRLPVPEACDLVRQAALGLEHIAARGLTHRDMKPANLLCTPGGQVKVVDLGLARVTAREDAASTLTTSPVHGGTPDHMAPEQARDPQTADIRADIYSLGCTLYELLAGRPPFPGGSVLQKLIAHQEWEPPPLRELRPDVPRPIEFLVGEMMARHPARRPKTPGEVARRLDAFLRGAPLPVGRTAARKWPRWVAGLAALAGVGLASAALVAFAPGWFRGQPAAPESTSAGVIPAPTTAPAGPVYLNSDDITRTRAGLRQRAVEWVRDNNRWGADADIVRETSKDAATILEKHDGFQVTVGSGLTRSGKPALVAANLGGVFPFELQPGDEAALNLKPSTRRVTGYRRVEERRLAKPVVALSAWTVDNADALARGARVTGSVRYQIQGASAAPLVLRMVHYPPGTNQRVSGLYHARPALTGGEGVLAFDFPAVFREDSKLEVPVVVFLDVVTQEEVTTTVVSNTLAQLVRHCPVEPSP